LDRRIGGSEDRAIPRSRDRSILRYGTLLACLSCFAAPAAAQYPDARLVPRGVLRLGFEPQYLSWGERFDSTGMRQPLGTDFNDSAAGVRLFPTLFAPQSAVASIIGDTAYRMDLGLFRTTLDADIRRFPLTVQFGLTSRIALTAELPIVTTRSQVDFVVDSTASNVGWNQAADPAGSATAIQQIQTLLVQLDAAAAAVEAGIAAGDYGCPTGATCDEARAAVAAAQQLRLDLTALSGVDETGTLAPLISPFAPTAGSAAGAAILGAIQSVAARFQALGAPAVSGTFPLPGSTVGSGAVNTMLPDTAFGYWASPLAMTKYTQKLGDIEVGLRFGLLQGGAARTVLWTTVRLPTGMLDSPDDYLDIGTGDHQMDVEFGFEGAWEAGTFLGIAASASYNLQLGDQLVRRVTSHVEPIAPLSTRTLVSRNLGDELRAAVYPSIRLSRIFTAYGSASYYRKASDQYTLAGSGDAAGLDPALLAFETGMSMWSFGGGLHYYAAQGRSGPALPIEAGIDFRSAFQGKGGQTPKSTSVNFYLRIPIRIFGRSPATPAEGAEPPPPASTEPPPPGR
jgi:hypothetical protein